MARIMTARELSTAQIVAIRDEVKRKLIAYAVKETGKSADEFYVRDAMALQDFGLGSEKWDNESTLTTVAWTKDWSKELPKTQFVAFYGVDYPVGDATPAAWKYMGVSYRLGVNGATTLKQLHLQKCQRTGVTEGATATDVEAQIKSARGYHRPVYYKGTDTIYVSLVANAAVTALYEKTQLLGLIAEPYGAVISG